MKQEPTLIAQTRKIFAETVDIYRKDFLSIVKNPLPIVIVAGMMILLWLVVSWV